MNMTPKETVGKAGLFLFYSCDGPLTASGATEEAKYSLRARAA